MKIIIGANVNEPGGFRIFDSEGNELSDKLMVKRLHLALSAENRGPTTVLLECYADNVEILEAQADVTIIGREDEPQ